MNIQMIPVRTKMLAMVLKNQRIRYLEPTMRQIASLAYSSVVLARYDPFSAKRNDLLWQMLNGTACIFFQFQNMHVNHFELPSWCAACTVYVNSHLYSMALNNWCLISQNLYISLKRIRIRYMGK